jgi:hypothetical protein
MASYQKSYLNLECQGHAYELNCPPALITKNYTSAAGLAIIDEAVAACDCVKPHPVASNWFDNTGSSGTTDDRIDSVHSADFDLDTPMKPVVYIIQNGKHGASAIGFAVFETADGCLIGHLKGSYDFVCPYSPVPLPPSVLKSDCFSIVNRQRVFGANSKAIPSDGDSWTESTTGWTADNGGLSVVPTGNKVGSFALQCNDPDVSHTAVYDLFRRSVGETLFFGKAGAKKVHFWWLYQVGYSNMDVEVVRLYAPDSSIFFMPNFLPKHVVEKETSLLDLQSG